MVLELLKNCRKTEIDIDVRELYEDVEHVFAGTFKISLSNTVIDEQRKSIIIVVGNRENCDNTKIILVGRVLVISYIRFPSHLQNKGHLSRILPKLEDVCTKHGILGIEFDCVGNQYLASFLEDNEYCKVRYNFPPLSENDTDGIFDYFKYLYTPSKVGTLV